MPHRIFLQKLSNRQRYIFGVVSIGILIFLMLVAVDQVFQIRKMEVSRKADYYGNEQLVKNLKGLQTWHGSNMLFVKTEAVEKQLYDNNPSIRNVTVTKQYPSTLIIAVRFHQPFARFTVDDGYFTLSEDGRIISKEREPRGVLPEILYYQKLHYSAYQVGDSLDYEDILAALHFLAKTLDLGFKINNIDIKGPDMLGLYAQDKKLIFTTEKDMALQEYQLGILTKQFKIEGKDFSVMDFRFDKPVIELKIAN